MATMKFADGLKMVVTSFSGGVLTFGAASSGCRTLKQVVADGTAANDPKAIKFNDSNIPFTVTDGVNSETGSYTISADGSSATRDSVLSSTNGGAPVASWGTSLVAFNDITAAWANGTTIDQLPAIASTSVVGSNIFELHQSSGDVGLTVDNLYTYLVNRMQAAGLFSGTTTETLAIGTIPTPQTVGTAYTVSGTWTGTKPTALDYATTDNGGTQGLWNNATTSLLINADGTWSFSVTPTTASTSRTMQVRDHNAPTVISGQSNQYVVNAAAVADTTPPTASSAVVANATPTVVAITFSEAMNTSYVPAASAFTVSGHTVSSVAFASGSNTILNIAVSAAFVNGEAASTLTYTQPGTNNLRDSAGNLLGNILSLAITNNVAASTPTYNVTMYGDDALVTANVDGTSPTGTFGSLKQFQNAKLFTGNYAGYFTSSPTPPTDGNGNKFYSGWVPGGAAAPTSTITQAQNTASGNSINGLTPAGSGANGLNQASLWVGVGSGTTTWDFYIKPSDGAAKKMGSVTVVGA